LTCTLSAFYYQPELVQFAMPIADLRSGTGTSFTGVVKQILCVINYFKKDFSD
jgi:hypothetical protein